MNKTFTFLALCLLLCLGIDANAQSYDECGYAGPSSPTTVPVAPINPAYTQTGAVICVDGTFPECSAPADAAGGTAFAGACGSPNFDFIITNPADVATTDGGAAILGVSGDGALDPSALGFVVGDDVCMTGFCYDLADIQLLIAQINASGSACSAAASLAGVTVCPIPPINSLNDLFALAGSLGGGGGVSIGDVITILPQLDNLSAIDGSITALPVCGLVADAAAPDYCMEVVDCAAGSPCVAPVAGCMDPCAPNYDPLATVDDGSCGAYDMTCNTDCTAGPFGGTWDAATCGCINETAVVSGCTDSTADNYNPAANCDDGSCATAPSGSCGSCPAGGGLFITELSFNPATSQGNDSDCEYIEIYNGYANAVSLDGVVLSNGIDFAFPAGSSIASGEYIIVALNPGGIGTCAWPAAIPAGTQIFGPFDDGVLGNSNPEAIVLTNTCADDGTAIVTMVTYAGDNGDGDENSVNYTIGTGVEYAAGPTPGTGDCAGCTEEYVCGTVASCELNATTTNIACNDNGTPDDSSDDTYTFDVTVSGTGNAASYADDQGNTALTYGTAVSYGPFPISGGATTVTFTDAGDATCSIFADAQPPATCSNGSAGSCGACVGNGGLFISELNFNPATSQGNDSDCEYIEIYNGFSNSVSLDNVVISNGLDFAFPAGSTIASGEYIIVALNPGGIGNCGWTVPAGTQVFGPFDDGVLGNSNPETLVVTLTCTDDASLSTSTIVTYAGNIGDGDGNSVNYVIGTGTEFAGVPSPGSGDCTGCTGSTYDCGVVVDVPGCMDECSANYNPAATVDDGSCSAQLNGCTNPNADNYDPNALCEDGSCILTCDPVITSFPANGGN